MEGTNNIACWQQIQLDPYHARLLLFPHKIDPSETNADIKKLLATFKSKALRNHALDLVIHRFPDLYVTHINADVDYQPASREGTKCNLLQDRVTAVVRGISASYSQAHEGGL
jgi:hypothetical protein